MAHGAGWVKEAESPMGLNVMRTGWGRKVLVGLLGALWLAGPAWAETAPTAQQARPAAPLAQPQGEPRPAIWLLADEDTRIYLFGTVHVLHPDLRWRSVASTKARFIISSFTCSYGGIFACASFSWTTRIACCPIGSRNAIGFETSPGESDVAIC